MYRVEDLIEGTVEKMDEVKIINMAQEFHDEVEDGWPEEDREVKPETLKECAEYLDVFGFRITKA